MVLSRCSVARLLEIFLLYSWSLRVVSTAILSILLIFSIVLTFLFHNSANIFDNTLINFFWSQSASIRSSKSSCTNSARSLKTSKVPSVASLLLFSSLINWSIFYLIFASNLACASWSAFLNFLRRSLIVCCDLFSAIIVININVFYRKIRI